MYIYTNYVYVTLTTAGAFKHVFVFINVYVKLMLNNGVDYVRYDDRNCGNRRKTQPMIVSLQHNDNILCDDCIQTTST